jgi:hypothetical protein
MYRFLEIYNIETKNGLALLDGLQQSNEVAAMAA